MLANVPKGLFKASGRAKRLREKIGPEGFRFLCHTLQAFSRILPHTHTDKWVIRRAGTADRSRVRWEDSSRRAIVLGIVVETQAGPVLLASRLMRRSAPTGVGAIERTLDTREYDISSQIAGRAREILSGAPRPGSGASLRALMDRFDEQAVAAHLLNHHDFDLDLGVVFASLRHLAELSYENRSLAYGLLIRRKGSKGVSAFPGEFLAKKRYRAMSDGYRTAFEVGPAGQVMQLVDLQAGPRSARRDHFCPDWARFVAEAATKGSCGVCLTRQGDILVMDSGNLRFTYRSGRWQYWNHGHACDLFGNRARVQNVPSRVVAKVVRSIYRVALDVSFRRTGALMVLLGNRRKLRKLVIEGDAIGDETREEILRVFDESLGDANIQTVPRAVLAEVAGIDGGIVLDNKGRILAYGAVLKTSGRFSASEGSRTKAAIAASSYGIAVKISADGDIGFFEDGKAFLEL